MFTLLVMAEIQRRQRSMEPYSMFLSSLLSLALLSDVTILMVLAGASR